MLLYTHFLVLSFYRYPPSDARYTASLRKKMLPETLLAAESCRVILEFLSSNLTLSCDQTIAAFVQLSFICDMIHARHRFSYYIFKIASLYHAKRDSISSYDLTQLAGECYGIKGESFYEEGSQGASSYMYILTFLLIYMLSPLFIIVYRIASVFVLMP
jgi:hypothetical protein